MIVGQPEFFAAIDKIIRERPLADWKLYLRWHLLRSAAPYLHHEAEQEDFAFYSTKLRGQPEPEPRWQRAALPRERGARVQRSLDRRRSAHLGAVRRDGAARPGRVDHVGGGDGRVRGGDNLAMAHLERA